MTSSMNVHNAKSIAVRQQYFDGITNFWLHEITVTVADGSEFRLCVMGDKALQIEGSDHINFVASPEVELFDAFTETTGEPA